MTGRFGDGAPRVERVLETGQDIIGLAAGICYGRNSLREPGKEDALLRFLLDQDPQHLTCLEHARYNLLGPWPNETQYQWMMGPQCPEPPKILPYRARGDYSLGPSNEPKGPRLGAIWNLNLSQVLAMREAPMGLGWQLARAVAHTVPVIAGHVWPDAVFPKFYQDIELEFHRIEDWALGNSARLFANYSFRVTCSRSCSHELVRHRKVSHEQRSQRYVAEGFTGPKKTRVAQPIKWRWPPRVSELRARVASAERRGERWTGEEVDVDTLVRGITMMELGWEENYRRLIEAGWPPQDARAVLPNACETQLICTAPMWAWLHFLRLRTHHKAQEEIRALAIQVFDELLGLEPWIAGKVTPEPAGLEPWLRP